jgi:hypothetical protein
MSAGLILVFFTRDKTFFALTNSLNYELSALIPVYLFINVHLIGLRELESNAYCNNATATLRSSRECI